MSKTGAWALDHQEEMASLKELEEKYYPIYWKIVDDEIEIWDRNNSPIWGLNSLHIKYNKYREDYKKIHTIERSFIEEKIRNELQFSGEIVCIW